ncbi:hypothetical protein MTO96_025613, partial [Rhipicephalus appendiculatus]
MPAAVWLPAFRSLDCGRGDVVAIHCVNSCELIVAICGTFFAGGVASFIKTSLKEVFGMTELAGCMTASSPRGDDFKSVGKPVPFMEIKVAHMSTRKPLGPGEEGEICIKGPCTFLGYLNKPKETADAYEDGFLRTGDTGYYSADGRLFVCSRFKELIKCMDQQVPPAEIEELLATDPNVQQVVVAGVPHPQYGEAARAFVVPRRRLVGPVEEQLEADRLKTLVAVEVKNLQMKIKFDFTRRQERPVIVGFQAEGQRYVELQEDTTTPSHLETIAHIAGATVDGLVAQ